MANGILALNSTKAGILSLKAGQPTLTKLKMSDKRIVILDADTISEDRSIWSPLESLGNVEAYGNTQPENVAARINGAWVVLTNKVPVSAHAMEQTPSLKYIGVLATGYNIVDIDAAHRLGITVTNIPGYSTDSVTQLVFALLLELTNHTGNYSQEVNAGRWERSQLFSFRLSPIVELAGLTMGIYGFGTIGRRVAEIARAFGMKVITPSNKTLPEGVEYVEPEEFWKRADVISINAAFTPEQAGLVNARTIAMMKPTAYLINTARGGFVDEQALADALNSDRLAGAGIDVLNQEPPRNGSPLIGARNCVITPHVAWQSTEALRRLVDIAVANLKAFDCGNPSNVIS